MRKADYGKNSSGMSVATLGSMTAAMKAQHILANAAIRTEVTKISDAAGARGCIYGVVFPSAQLGNVKNILSAARVSVRRYDTSGGDFR